MLDAPSSPLILVVDDDMDGREVCAMSLRMLGFRTEEANDGPSALAKAFALRPDAILLDQAMPIMDGQEVARRLKADARTRDTPLVMLTGFGASTAPGRALRADGRCAFYLVKPCEIDEVVAALRAALRSAEVQPA